MYIWWMNELIIKWINEWISELLNEVMNDSVNYLNNNWKLSSWIKVYEINKWMLKWMK